MGKEQQTEMSDAFGLFPDLMQNLFGSSEDKKKKKSPEEPATETREVLPESKRGRVVPPLPPDLSGLQKGVHEDQEEVEDIPAVLLLMGTEDKAESLSSDWQDLGYRVEMAESPDKAIEKLMATHFSAVLLHTDFEEEPLAKSLVHSYLTWLPTPKRRTLFYILAGPDLHTLYDIEALSLSANLVINDENINQLIPILRKSFREYEELFGPLLETLNAYGKE